MKKRLLPWLAGLCRTVLALTFLLSGWVKANDPVGTAVKLDDYATAAELPAGEGLPTLVAAVALAAVEFALGVCLLLGLNRRTTSRLTVAVMTVMTAITAWLYATDAVSDCGCFGDVLILTNGETLAKNIVLMGCALVVARWYRMQRRLIGEDSAWLISTPLMAGIVAYALWCIYRLPVVDFRPYHVGADIRAMWEHPRLKSRRTFRLHELDVAELTIMTAEQPEDITEDVLYDEGYTLLLVAPDLGRADQGCAGNINELYDFARAEGWSFYCLTASGSEAQERWRDYTGAEYGFCLSDERLLMTMVRANPGLLLLHDGKVAGKWSGWNLPDESELKTLPPAPPKGEDPPPCPSQGRGVYTSTVWVTTPLPAGRGEGVGL